jgi:hypothetical protein
LRRQAIARLECAIGDLGGNRIGKPEIFKPGTLKLDIIAPRAMFSLHRDMYRIIYMPSSPRLY